MSFRNRCVVALAVMSVAFAGMAVAQDNWPSRPVKLIVPSSPGGGTDVFARLLAQALSDSLKQPFVVENRAGASGNIGTDAVAHAAPDGYTFLVSANASLAINPVLQKSLSYDIEKDLAPVARGVMAINVLVVGAPVGAKTVAEFVALAKKQPGTLAYGSAGTGTSPYLGVRKFEDATGSTFLHVPYKGVAPAYQDLLGARLQFMYTDLASALPYVQSGKMIALAVDRKSGLLPQVGTFAESGLASFHAPTSFSVMAPAAVARPIVNRFAAEIARALKTIAPRLEQLALEPVYDTPDEFADSLRAERAMWGEFIQRKGITAD